MQGKTKRKPRSKGLGDTIEKITEATGIKKAVEFIAGEDCGCDKRREKLNKMFPYPEPKCLNEDEFLKLGKFFDERPVVLSLEEQLMIITTFNRVFSQRRKMTKCAPCLKSMINDLENLFNEYGTE